MTNPTMDVSRFYPGFDGPAKFTNEITFEDNITVEGNLTVEGNFTFGDASTDSLAITGKFSQTYTGTDDGHTVLGSGDLVAGKDLVRFSSTGNISSTSNVVAIEQTTGAGTAGAYGLYINCTGTNVEALKVDAGKAVFDEQVNISGVLELDAAGGASASNAILMGIGTTASPATTSTANKSFMEFRTQSTATSGDSRALYLRHDLNGAGVSGEAIRAFSKITAATATARGAHISLDVDTATGSVSGLGSGVDSQILVGDGVLSEGTYAIANLEAYSAGASTDVSSVTKFDIMRVSLGGNATGAATVDAKANLFNFEGVTAGSGNLIDTTITTHTAYGGIPVNIDGVGVRYIALVSA